MKNLSILILLVFVFGLFACQEDELDVAPEIPKYDLSDSDTDELQHQKYLYNKEYGIIVIDDVDSSDYQYTMTSEKLDLTMRASQKTDEEKAKVLKVLRKTFFGKYPDDFLKKFAPLRLILADSIGRMEMKRDWSTWPPVYKLTWVSSPLFINKSIMAVAINDEEFVVSEDGESASVVDEWGSHMDIAATVMSKVVIDNILRADHGDQWGQLFLPILGQFRPYLYFDDGSQTWDTGFTINFGEEHYDPSDPDNLTARPMSEYPGVFEDDPQEQNYEAIEAYMNELGFPNSEYVRYYPEDGPHEWDPTVYPEAGRIKAWVEVLIPMWIRWSGSHSDTEKEALFAQYPELKKNYLKTKELLMRYANIEI